MILPALDTVLAFSMIMLLLSMLVTVLVQMAISVLGLRGRNLLWGVRQLVGSMAPELGDADVETLARKILSHPSLSGTKDKLSPFFRKFLDGKRPPMAIQPKELLLVLDELRRGGQLQGTLQETVERLFETPPSEGSRLARSLELLAGLESRFPEQAGEVRAAVAGALEETREVVVRLHDWFDGAMEQARERLKLGARWWTVGFAVLLAVPLQIDSIDILGKLWANPELRLQLVERAGEAEKLFDRQMEATRELRTASGRVGDADASTTAELGKIEEQQSVIREQISELRTLLTDIRQEIPNNELEILLPGESYWQEFMPRLPGSLVTVILLSLGAPFWHGVLGKLVGFRSTLVKKKDGEARG